MFGAARHNAAMDTNAKAPYGPKGDPAHHLALADLTAGYAQLPANPTEHGKVTLICQRRADGTRIYPSSAHLSRSEGLHGDAWSSRPPRDPNCQVTVINSGVAELIANGQPLGLFGDNLFVTLDLSDRNLPAGSRLQVGTAVAEVTSEPHDGCAKFHARFGAAALRFVQDRRTRSRNLRGIHWRIIQDGDVHVGSPVTLLHRGTPPDSE